MDTSIALYWLQSHGCQILYLDRILKAELTDLNDSHHRFHSLKLTPTLNAVLNVLRVVVVHDS